MIFYTPYQSSANADHHEKAQHELQNYLSIKYMVIELFSPDTSTQNAQLNEEARTSSQY